VKAAFIVIIDLDPVAGSMSTVESAHAHIQGALNNVMGHYNPEVHQPTSEIHDHIDQSMHLLDDEEGTN
jgi:hypothetical protein